jgi:O-antigen/teichoic acid export membrane protein
MLAHFMKSLLISRIKLNKTESLSAIVRKNSFYSLILKVLSILLSFWSIRVAFEFTGSQQIYGLWLTILSVVSWLGLLNGGLGNGLRNKLSQAIATNNIQNAKIYVSTSYVFITVIAITCCIIFTVVTLFVDWRYAFNATYISKTEFLLLFLVIVISYFFQLILSTLNAVCFANNQSTLPSLFIFLSNLLYVICLYILKLFNIKGLLILGFVYCLTILVVLLFANLFLFSRKYEEIKPEVSYFNKLYIKELIGNGVKFFLLEISAVIIFTTDSMVITHVVGSEEVTIYQLVMKLFSVFTIVSSTVMVPLWSAYTHAYSKGDIKWIKLTMKKMLTFSIPLILGILIYSLLVNSLLKIWIGNNIAASYFLVLTIAMYIIISIWSNFFAYFLNGINKINGQLLMVGIGAILNIPLSIYMAKEMELGTIGVVLASIISLIPFAIFGPIFSLLEIRKVSSPKGN